MQRNGQRPKSQTAVPRIAERARPIAAQLEAFADREVDSEPKCALLPMLGYHGVPQQIPRRRAILKLLRKLDCLLPLFGLSITSTDPHQGNQLCLLALGQRGNLLADFLAGKIIPAILQHVPHLVVDRVGP